MTIEQADEAAADFMDRFGDKFAAMGSKAKKRVG